MKPPIRFIAPLVTLAFCTAELGAQGFPSPPDRDGQGFRRPGPPPGGGRGAGRERGGGPRPEELGEADLDLGEPGIAWYPKLEDGLAEAKRSNRPILFMSVASQCGGVPGVFWPGYTATQNSLFSDKKVIEASRKFVCVRIESYESEENQKIVRSYLNGRFENTAFCVLAPDGKTRLTRSGRAPQHASRDFDDIAAIADRYKARGDVQDSRLPDFNSFKLALNVASADQRLLVLVTAREDELKKAEKRLRELAWGEDTVGRFHYELSSDPKEWREALSRPKGGAGIYLIKPDTFGLEGEVVSKLGLDVPLVEIKKALAAANREFAKSTEKKVYSEHVSEGRREGKKIEMAMPYGEDRDGDGEIDFRGGRRGR